MYKYVCQQCESAELAPNVHVGDDCDSLNDDPSTPRARTAKLHATIRTRTSGLDNFEIAVVFDRILRCFCGRAKDCYSVNFRVFTFID